AHPAEAVQRAEPVGATGDDLVRVALVAGVPDDLVARRLEHLVERERQLDGAEVRADVSAGDGVALDQEPPDLRGEIVELAEARRADPIRGELGQLDGQRVLLSDHDVYVAAVFMPLFSR